MKDMDPFFYLTFNRGEEKEDSPLILEKILFPAHSENHFWENEVKPVRVGSHNPVLYRQNEQYLSVSSLDFVLEHSYPLKIKRTVVFTFIILPSFLF